MLAKRHSLRKKHCCETVTREISSIAKSKKESQIILQCLQKQDNRDHASGSTLPSDMRHFEVVETLLLTGIRISKVDDSAPSFRKIFSKVITSRSHMNDPIPAVLEKEKEKLKAELHNVKEGSIIFDRTTRLGGALAIVLIWDDRPTRLRNTRFGFSPLLYFCSYVYVFNDWPFLYDIMGGSLRRFDLAMVVAVLGTTSSS